MNQDKSLALTGTVVGALVGGVPGAIIGGIIGSVAQEYISYLCPICHKPMKCERIGDDESFYCEHCGHRTYKQNVFSKKLRR